MNIIEQVQQEAGRITGQYGSWDSAAALSVLYADTLETIFSRLLVFQNDLEEMERMTGMTPTAYNIIQAMLQPMDGWANAPRPT